MAKKEDIIITLDEAKATLANQKWRLRSGQIYKIKQKEESKPPLAFRPNRVQRQLFDNLHNKNIIVKGRQQGLSTFIDLFLLDVGMFKSNNNIGIIAHTEDAATNIFNNIVKFAYDNLPADLRESMGVDVSKAGVLKFSNGSSISVGTSFRSGTLQYLHISEFGSICAKYPDKANEIITGALNTLAPGGVVFIESTAEGDYGHYYDMCQVAIKKAKLIAEGKRDPLTKMEYKFFFFPWYHDVTYVEGSNIPLSRETLDYFDGVMSSDYYKGAYPGEKITEDQMRWYQQKKEEMPEKMRQEFPCTPNEAFLTAVKGAYYMPIIMKMRRAGRMTLVPKIDNLPVYTAWDIGGAGGGDDCVIWFFQVMGTEIRVFDYWEGSGMSMVDIARQEVLPRPYRYGEHFLPHDARVHEQSTGKMRVDYLTDMGMNCMVLAKDGSVSDAIELTRSVLPNCIFDLERTSAGVTHLQSYSRAFNNTKGIAKDAPDHNEHSHAADGFRYLSKAVHILIPNFKTLGTTEDVKPYTTRTKQSRSEMVWAMIDQQETQGEESVYNREKDNFCGMNISDPTSQRGGRLTDYSPETIRYINE